MLRHFLSLTFSLTLAFPARAADWPQLLGPGRDGHSAETKLNWNWPKEGPKLLWKLDAGAGWAGPVVAGERLIHFHRVGDNEIVLCLDPATGKEKWQHKYPTKYKDDFNFDDGPRATPTIAGDKVFTLGMNDKGEFVVNEGVVKQLKTMNETRIIELSTPVSSIGSGGPVLDSFGRVVGIATAPHKFGNVNAAIASSSIADMRSRTHTP
jgi:hypothetical protein